MFRNNQKNKENMNKLNTEKLFRKSEPYFHRSRGASKLNCRFLLTFVLLFLFIETVDPCGPGRGYGFRRGPRKMTPLVYKQHVPSVSEATLGASGPPEGRILRGDARMKKLVVNYNKEILFKDEEGTGADRIMSKRCKELLDALSVLVMNQWEGVRLRVTEAWDEEDNHAPESLHYEGRAVDITTDDRDRSKYGMLARLAVEVGFDWVYYESRGHVHCSVKSDSSITLRTGGCFSGDDEVEMESGQKKPVSDIIIGDRILAMDSNHNPIYDEVVGFIHRDIDLPMTFQILELSDGRKLTLTSDHLIYTMNESSERNTVFAGKLQKGSFVYALKNNESLENNTEFQILSVDRVEFVRKTGVYAPLTYSGNIVVNGVAASCYASVSSHWLAHISMTPMRWSAYFDDVTNRRDVSQQIEGIHWLAEILQFIGKHLLPSSYWYT